jgi:hypothetical protein
VIPCNVTFVYTPILTQRLFAESDTSPQLCLDLAYFYPFTAPPDAPLKLQPPIFLRLPLLLPIPMPLALQCTVSPSSHNPLAQVFGHPVRYSNPSRDSRFPAQSLPSANCPRWHPLQAARLMPLHRYLEVRWADPDSHRVQGQSLRLTQRPPK